MSPRHKTQKNHKQIFNPQSVFQTSLNIITSIAYVDDLAILTNKIHHIQPQVNELRQYVDWAHMIIGITKCVVTNRPNKSKLQMLAITTYLKAQNINYKNQQLPILSQNEPYISFTYG